MSLMTRGQALINRGKAAAAGEEIVYTRVDGVTTFTGTAWTAREFSQPGPVTEVRQVRLNTNERVYLIPAELFTDNLPPDKGGRIAVTINGVACVFEVMPTESNNVWRWSDEGRTRYRVNTKRVA